VDVCAGAGVAGAADVDASGAGAGFGSLGCRSIWSAQSAVDALALQPYLVHDADNEPLLLNLVGLNGVLILKDFACGARSANSPGGYRAWD
jgi:hypothetical protein